ncbi:MAG: dihydrolipoamide acetyltransferase family protein [Aeromicrobium sp.]
MSEFNLPDVGEGLTEAEIVAWKVAVGDVIKINDIIVDIETAKSIVELPSPYEGTIEALLVAEGETVPVGTPIIRIVSADEPASPAPASPAPVDEVVSDVADSAQEMPAAEERQAVLVGYGPRTASLKRRARRSTVASVDTEKVSQRTVPPVAVPATPAPVRAPQNLRVLAKPPVRKLAKDLGIDLHDVPAAGDIITRADVEAFAGGGSAVSLTPGPSAPVRSAAGDTRIPIKGVRKMMADAMVSSAFTAPHVTEWVTIDVTRTMELVARLKADPAFAGVRVSPLLVVAKAVCLAMRRTPALNSSWDEAAREIVLKGAVNLGIAAATPRGLVVPNIVGADSMTMLELAQALGELTRTAREGKTQPAQMVGGSFTITNIGVFGIDSGTPILNPGEAGILAVGAINKRPWVDADEQLVVRSVTTLALSFDHRLVDGEKGSRFLADVASILNDPGFALTY